MVWERRSENTVVSAKQQIRQQLEYDILITRISVDSALFCEQSLFMTAFSARGKCSPLSIVLHTGIYRSQSMKARSSLVNDFGQTIELLYS